MERLALNKSAEIPSMVIGWEGVYMGIEAGRWVYVITLGHSLLIVSTFSRK